MAGLSLSVVTPPDVRARFARAAAGEPLSALSPHARAELEAVLAQARDVDDLPGKWQAALARAEAAVRGDAVAEAGGSCCGGGATL